MKKKILFLFMACLMLLSTVACSTSSSKSNGDKKILRTAASFAYPSLDVHKEYYGWYTSIYGVSEALFKMNSKMNAVPCLAKDAEVDGTVWTIHLNKKAAFSNGKKLTADMVVRNLQRVAKENERFSYVADFNIIAADDETVVIDTKEVYPTLKNDLASPEFGMIDLDDTKDFTNNPICTGPFVIKKFKPEGDVEVAKNEKYWDGKVKLDGAIFYYMQEDDPKLLAMQSGEIDCYNSVSSAALEVYKKDPKKYDVVSIPGARLQYYILNENTLDASVREAINLTVDKKAIEKYLSGTVTAATSPFVPSAKYGKVNIPKTDVKKAVKLLEADGYTKGSDGFYQKDGKKLNIRIAYYAARSLDTLALLIQEQLKAIGVDSTLRVEEDPDQTYIKDQEFELALYCMISDKSGDPLYFIDSTLKDGSYYDCGGFNDAKCEELINKLKYEVDPDKRAELANEIIQIAVDDNAFGYVGLFNNTTVLKKGTKGFAENIPFDFYGIDKDTVIK